MRQKEVCRGIKPLDKLSKNGHCVKETWDIFGLDRAGEDLKKLNTRVQKWKGMYLLQV